MKKSILLCSFALVILLSVAASAGAADNEMNLQLFRPSPFGGNFLAIQDSQTLCPWKLGGGLYFDYADSTFTWLKDDDVDFDVISAAASWHATASLGTARFLSIGVDVPFHRVRERPLDDFETVQGLPELETSTAMGDVLAALKFRLLYQEAHWIGWALIPYVTFPSGDAEKLTGEGRATFGGTMVLEHDFGLFNLALNGGYLYRGTTTLLDNDVGGAVKYGAGLSRDYSNGLGFSVEYWGSAYDITYNEPDTVSPYALSGDLGSNPMEWTATLRYRFGKNGPRLIAGGGNGASGGVGAPAYRLMGGIDYHCRDCKPKEGELVIETVDQNGKGLSAELKIMGPDGKESTWPSEGRATLRTKSGRHFVSAAKTGYESASGTAEVPSGSQAVLKLSLKEIPKVPEKTILSVVIADKCSAEKLSADLTLKDVSGSSKTLSVTGTGSKEELAAGAYDYSVKAGGYVTKTGKIEVVKEKTTDLEIKLLKKIELKDKIFFEVNSDKILPKSFSVIDNVADQIKKLCEYKRISIEGHTSNEGNETKNIDLSRRRALAVKNYLIQKGIDAAKLDSAGFGSGRPIASNAINSGREQNRRVEFQIEE